MKTWTKSASNWLSSLLAVVLLAGCVNTITPTHVQSSAYSWDGTNQNSGVLAMSNHCAIVTSHAVDRYNALMTLYGKAWAPPVKPWDGVTATPTNGVYILDAQHTFYFSTANRWKKEGKDPPK